MMHLGSYIRRSAVTGDVDIILSCNSTHSSDVKWTQNTTGGYFNYVFVNGNINDYRDFLFKFSVVNSSNLRIYIPEAKDSGLYDCYDPGGRRIVGYNLTVTGIICSSLHIQAHSSSVQMLLIALG